MLATARPASPGGLHSSVDSIGDGRWARAGRVVDSSAEQ